MEQLLLPHLDWLSVQPLDASTPQDNEVRMKYYISRSLWDDAHGETQGETTSGLWVFVVKSDSKEVKYSS